MASGENGTGPLDEDILERQLSVYLDPDETVERRLVNTRVGLTHADSSPTTIEPGPRAGAVAAITGDRIVFVVGDPLDHDDEDFAATVSFDEIETVDKRTETLTQTLVVRTTDGERWEFTARKAGAVDEAVDALEARLAEHALTVAEEHHAAATATGDPAECAEQLEAALDAYRRAAELLGDERSRVSDAERTAREDAEAVIANLVSSHREHGEQSEAAAEWELAADNDESAYELFVESRDAYGRALELARAYPPGDPEIIEHERDAVAEAMEPLKIEFAVAEATDD